MVSETVKVPDEQRVKKGLAMNDFPSIFRKYVRFLPGDRVTRLKDVFNSASPLLHGTVICVYGSRFRWEMLDGELLDWVYPEQYDVEWDNGKKEKGYLPHGLDLEEV
jgi:hypothetical protein